MTLIDLLGNDDAHWMATPGRPCAAPSDKALDIRYHADAWFVTNASRAYAKAKCNGCPVKAQCLEYALPDPNLEGIFGGLNETDRAKLRNGAAA